MRKSLIHGIKYGALVLALLLGACSAPDISQGYGNIFETGDKNVRVMFSDPGYDYNSGRDAGLQREIANMIASAQNTVDVCIYELSEPTIYTAMMDAFDRGVDVRFVGDLDNMRYEGYIALMDKGIPMSLGNPDKIMHNKYVIVDDRYMCTGSMNFTLTGAYHNNENVVFIDSPQVCAYYKKDFNVMYSNNLFGIDKIDHRFDGFEDNEFVITNNDGTTTEIEVHVVPYYGYGSDKRIDYQFMDYIREAEESIYFAVFAYTHPEIAQLMIDVAMTKGIQVYGIFDHAWHTGNEYALHHEFINALTYTSNIHVVYDGNFNWMIDNPLHGGKCHNKYMVIDPCTSNGFVVTGSYNFSKAASYKGNDENFVAIRDPELAEAYQENALYMYNLGWHPTRDRGGDTAEYHDVIISEVMWAGSKDADGTESRLDKFIELKNTTDQDINISGWQLVGTTAVSKSYRILMKIFPEDTVIPAGGHHVLAYSTNQAWNLTNATIDYFLYLHHPYDQNYINLTLKDSYNQVIDNAGTPGLAPFAGSDGATFRSMERDGDDSDGAQASSWDDANFPNANVVESYRANTWATPGQ